ncbi:transcription factor bHLH144-like [Magnolia sinica]|uniref:transcription factor bHLH144-like n=1 Tax=Magnolia sinica TaxID=86752 RepID=UPI00265922EF|nr:transcription factor bHLH144-like [Magnolia sinica]XP_058095288.1 transcription factor bHLH144-like [Magnolia sinica]XP_058095289.1 transcription factor bHLH144-like [Magnolia sinica]
MHSDQKAYTGKAAPPVAYGVGGCTYDISVPPAVDMGLVGPKQAGLFQGVELQASEMCPKNFIIFDRTDNKSRIMFHPALANKFSYPGFDIQSTYAPENPGSKHTDKDSSSLKEDTKDIDALLSLEDEEDEDEEVSTGRTMGNYGSSSPDFCSTDSLKSQKTSSGSASIQKSFSCSRNSSCGSSSSERKRHRMKKMLKALRGIVPGGDRMDTASFIDEAVRHLKHLKKEVKKLGMGNFKN